MFPCIGLPGLMTTLASVLSAGTSAHTYLSYLSYNTMVRAAGHPWVGLVPPLHKHMRDDGKYYTVFYFKTLFDVSLRFVSSWRDGVRAPIY